MVEFSAALVNRVLAQQGAPLTSVSGRTYDDDDRRVAHDAGGRLKQADMQIVFSASDPYVGSIVPISSSAVIEEHPLGDDIIVLAYTEFAASIGAPIVDLGAPAGGAGRVALRANVTVTYGTVSQAFKTIEPKGSLPYGPGGDFYQSMGLPAGPIVVSASPATSSGKHTALGQLTLSAPIRTAVDQQTGAIDVTADVAAATPRFTSDQVGASAVAASIEREVQASLGRLSAPGGSLLLTPRLSLVGALAAGVQVNEISVSNIEVGALPAAGPSAACLWVAVRLSGGTPGTASIPENFLAADYAYLCRDNVINAICAYRWRRGDYPTGYLGQPLSDSYKENGTTKAILVTTRLTQTDVLDGQSNVVGNIRQMAAPPARQEDFVEIGGHAHGAVDSVKHTDGTPVPESVRNSYADSAPFDYRLPVFLSNVGMPASNPQPSLDAYYTQMRARVTGHFSRPFAGAPGVALQHRAANGVDHLLLTQANVTTL